VLRAPARTFFVVVDHSRPRSYRVRSTCSQCLRSTGWTTKAVANDFTGSHKCDPAAARPDRMREAG